MHQAITVIEPQGQAPTRTMTFEEFLEWSDEDTWAEWVDGEVVMNMPTAEDHQDIKGFLLIILRLLVEKKDLGVVLDAPFLMKLPQRGREPDILFIAEAHRDRLKKTYLDGPADLAVEIISPESAARDRGEKFYEYEAAGVLEYWLIDPMREWAEFYHLGPDGRYRPVFVGREGEYKSGVLLDFRLQVEWLWQRPMPRMIDILQQLGVV